MSTSTESRNKYLWIVAVWIAAIFVIPPAVSFLFRIFNYENPVTGTMHFETAAISPNSCSSMFGAQALSTSPCVVKARYTIHPITDDFVVFLDNEDVVTFPQSRRPWMIVGEPRVK